MVNGASSFSHTCRRRTFLQAIFAGGGISACNINNLSQSRSSRLAYPSVLEPVFAFSAAMPTGVTVNNGRIFVCFPKWDDPVLFSVGEIVSRPGTKHKYPTPILNPFPSQEINNTLISVQSVVLDDKNVLWILDTGSPRFAPPASGAAKLISVDLVSAKILKTYPIPSSVMSEHTYLNDVRFDMGVGLPENHPGFAYITDSSTACIGGIIVLDLSTGDAVRRLNNSKYTNPDPNFKPMINHKDPFYTTVNGKQVLKFAATDGIEISPNKENLYFCPLSSDHVYSAPTRLLRDSSVSDESIMNAIIDYGDDAPADGLAIGPDGTLYAGNYRDSYIRKLSADGHWHTISIDPRIAWPDSLSVSQGYLYFIANQIPQLPSNNQGIDLRSTPYWLFRIKIS